VCPYCKQDAPLIYKGLSGYCTACGAGRGPLASPSVTYAGKPAQFGGNLARWFGWLVLALGAPLALLAFGILMVAFPGSAAPYLVGLPLLILSLSVWAFSYYGGKKLAATGDATERRVREQALLALGRKLGGTMQARDVTQALRMHPAAADMALLDLAKSLPDEILVDISDDGVLLYRMRSVPVIAKAPAKAQEKPKVRVDKSVSGVRVETKDEQKRVAIEEATNDLVSAFDSFVQSAKRK
jgi:hypothetical protein